MIQHFDHPDRIAERKRVLDAIAARDGTAARIEAARLAREIAAEQVAAGKEAPSVPSNFLPVERRIVTTTPAGQSLYSIPDPMPDRRDDPHGDRLRAADLARSIGQATTMSGTTSIRRSDDVGQWLVTERGLRPVVVTDRFGRTFVDWSVVGDGSDE